ncbi:hypothetical protein Vafri_20576, partial [Volvox africanus]
VWPYDAIITSPWPAVLDLVLPLATFFAPLVAMHVPSHAVTNAHGPRREYLQKLAEEGRLALMMGMPGAGQRGLWIVVFATRALKGIMLCKGTAGKGAWVINQKAYGMSMQGPPTGGAMNHDGLGMQLGRRLAGGGVCAPCHPGVNHAVCHDSCRDTARDVHIA